MALKKKIIRANVSCCCVFFSYNWLPSRCFSSHNGLVATNTHTQNSDFHSWEQLLSLLSCCIKKKKNKNLLFFSFSECIWKKNLSWWHGGNKSCTVWTKCWLNQSIRKDFDAQLRKKTINGSWGFWQEILEGWKKTRWWAKPFALPHGPAEMSG